MGCFSMPKGVPNKRYTGEFKQMVVKTMMREKLSYREAARQFEIPDHKDVAKWERYYLMDGVEGLYVERRGRGSKGRPQQFPKEVEEDLLKEVQRLRAENAYLKNCRPWFWSERDTRRKSKGDPGTEAKIQAGYAAGNRSASPVYILLP